jgi:hypothetical protein
MIDEGVGGGVVVGGLVVVGTVAVVVGAVAALVGAVAVVVGAVAVVVDAAVAGAETGPKTLDFAALEQLVPANTRAAAVASTQPESPDVIS